MNINETTTVTYVGRAKATRTRDKLTYNPVEQECVVHIGTIRGMTDNGQPGWTTGYPEKFVDPRDLITLKDHLTRYGWDFKDVDLTTFEIVKVTTKTTIETEIEILTDI